MDFKIDDDAVQALPLATWGFHMVIACGSLSVNE